MDNINMLYTGLKGSFLIAAVICFRHFFFHQIPKRFFVFLWICAITRLLFPFSIPVSESAGSWLQKTVSQALQTSDLKRQIQEQMQPDVQSSSSEQLNAHSGTALREHSKNPDARSGIKSADLDTFPEGTDLKKAAKRVQNAAAQIHLKEVFFVIWLSVAGMLAAGILIKHICTLRLYKTSLPFDNETAEKWLRSHSSFPKAALRRSEFVKSPLTYGVIRPVILLPSEISLSEEEYLCIMEHEWVHIRRKDVLVKYLLCLTVCIYWFHPLVFIMAVLLNRDIELACDEEVTRTCSKHYKKAYALVLIRLAQESRQSVWPLNACFARHSEIEERIRLIMNTKKYPKKAAIAAAGMLCCILTAFTASAQEAPDKAASQTENTGRNEAEISLNESEAPAAETQNRQENTSELSETPATSADSPASAAAQPDISDKSSGQPGISDVSKQSGIREHSPASATSADSPADVTKAATSSDSPADVTKAATLSDSRKGSQAATLSDSRTGMPAARLSDSQTDEAAGKAKETSDSRTNAAALHAGDTKAELSTKEDINAAACINEASNAAAGTRETPGVSASAGKAANAQSAADYKNISKEQQTAGEQIAELAKLYLGNPYKAGGTDLAEGTDSIGFVRAVYALAGIELPADIQALAAVGTDVPLDRLSAGDIIIYSSAYGQNQFFHAAVYDGSGSVIHASNMKTGIKLSAYNYREISQAIRIIN